MCLLGMRLSCEPALCRLVTDLLRIMQESPNPCRGIQCQGMTFLCGSGKYSFYWLLHHGYDFSVVLASIHFTGYYTTGLTLLCGFGKCSFYWLLHHRFDSSLWIWQIFILLVTTQRPDSAEMFRISSLYIKVNTRVYALLH